MFITLKRKSPSGYEGSVIINLDKVLSFQEVSDEEGRIDVIFRGYQVTVYETIDSIMQKLRNEVC